jgi:hypothetical protein
MKLTICKSQQTDGGSMTVQEKKSLVNIVGAFLLFGYFWFSVFPQHPPAGADAEEVLKFWGGTILWYVASSIAVHIASHILTTMIHTALTREQESSLMDERDRLFEMRVDRYSNFTFFFVFMLAMLLAVLNAAPMVVFKVLLVGLLVSQIVVNVVQFYLYRRGY